MQSVATKLREEAIAQDHAVHDMHQSNAKPPGSFQRARYVDAQHERLPSEQARPMAPLRTKIGLLLHEKSVISSAKHA
jgi:uncharacterized protein (DUF1800 family)